MTSSLQWHGPRTLFVSLAFTLAFAGSGRAAEPDSVGMPTLAGVWTLDVEKSDKTREAAAEVTVDLLDVSGRRRAHLYQGSAAPERTFEWHGRGDDGAPLAAGVYWIRAAIKSDRAGSLESVQAARIVVLP